MLRRGSHGVVLLFVLTALGAACSSDGGSSGAPPATAARVDGPARIVATIAVPDGPRRVATTSDAVWVVSDDAGSNALRVIDPASNEIEGTVDVDGHVFGIDTTRDAVWVTLGSDGVARIDPATREVVETIPVDGTPVGIAVTSDAVWVLDLSEPLVTRIDPATNAVVATVDGLHPDTCGDNGACDPKDIAATGDAVWVGMSDFDPGDSTIARIDPASNQVADRLAFDGYSESLATAGEILWVGDGANDKVVRIDATSNEIVETIEGYAPSHLDATARSVWFTTQDDLAVEIDPATNEVKNTVEVDFAPAEVAIADGAVWIAISGEDSVTLLDPGPS